MVFFIFTSIVLLLLFSLSLYYLREKKDMSIVLFLSVIYTVWMISNYLYPRLTTYNEALFFSKLIFSSTSFMFWGMLLMSVYYPSPIKDKKLIYFAWIYFVVALIEAYFSQFTDSIIRTLTYKHEISQFIFNFNIPAFLHYVIYVIVTVGAALYILNKRYRKSEGKELLQLKYLYWGLSISAAAAGFTNMVLPMGFNIFQYSDLGTFLGTFFLIVLLYTIAIERLYDLQYIITKALYWTLEIFITFIAFLGGYFWIFFVVDQKIPQMSDAVIFLMILLAGGITLTIRVMGERATPWEEAKSKLFTDLETSVATELQVDKLCSTVVKSIQKLLNVNSAAIILLDRDRRKILYKELRNFPAGDKINFQDLLEILVYWKEKGEDPIMMYDEISHMKTDNKRLKRIRTVMEQHTVRIIAPLNRRVVLNGLILLGDKLDSLPFTIQDTELIEKTIRIASVALGRALLYEEVHAFSDTLQQKVDESTKKLRENIVTLNEAQGEIKEKNKQLRTALNELKTLDKAKSEFISIASHQLRTPISIIKGYLSMLLEGDFGELPKEPVTAVSKASENIQQLNDIVEDILNASRIEKGKLVITPEKTDLIELLKNVVSQLQPKAEKKLLALKLETKIETFIALADRNKIYEVVVNLVDNAINYTPKGSITVSAEIEGDALLIKVKDTGIGIPPEFKEKMFKRFSRSDNARAIRPDGTGIGLYVVKAFIEAHKGDIWFDSTINKGTTFYLKLQKDPHFETQKS